jgi:molecular chaperone DnaJ
MTDPYSTLGIDRSATDDEVKKAYRAMCRKYHPDKNPGNQAAEEMFKIVQEAYEQIMNERKNGGVSGGYGGYANGGFYGQSSSASGEETYYQAAANYLNTGHYREALNVLSNIRNRTAQWYYMSAIANAGIGNNYAAQEQARTAVNMDPNNFAYRDLVNRLERGGFAYGNMQRPYYGAGGYNDDFCTKLCLANIIFNACCDCDPCCCC